MTNRRFNVDKFRVYKIDCQEFGGSFQDYLGRVTDSTKQDNPEILVNTPGIPSQLKGYVLFGQIRLCLNKITWSRG